MRRDAVTSQPPELPGPPVLHEGDLIGAMLAGTQGAVDLAIASLLPTDLSNPWARRLFVAMAQARGAGEPASFNSIIEQAPGCEEWAAWAFNQPWSTSGVAKSIERIRTVAKQRRLAMLLAEATDELREAYPAEQVWDSLASRYENDPTLRADDGVLPYWELGEYVDAAAAREPETWVIPGYLRDRQVVVVGGETGAGKRMLLHQFAAAAACGSDPFDPGARQEYPKRSVLLVDCENEDYHTADQMAAIDLPWRTLGARVTIYAPGRTFRMDHYRDRATLEAIIQRERPDIVVAGPVYHMFSRTGKDWESETRENFTAHWDALVRRYGFATLLEAHLSGKADRLFGSQIWEQWADFAVALRKPKEPGRTAYDSVWELNEIRPARRPLPEWPDALRWGRPPTLPWLRAERPT